MNKTLKNKIHSYKQSFITDHSKDKATRLACRDLEAQLGIDKVEPKAYRFLQAIASHVELGKDIDLTPLAKEAGYSKWQSQKPESNILRNIDDRLFDAILGVNRKMIHQELRKVINQDEDMSAKMRALELASKITGMHEQEGTKIQINFPKNIELGE